MRALNAAEVQSNGVIGHLTHGNVKMALGKLGIWTVKEDGLSKETYKKLKESYSKAIENLGTDKKTQGILYREMKQEFSKTGKLCDLSESEALLAIDQLGGSKKTQNVRGKPRGLATIGEHRLTKTPIEKQQAKSTKKHTDPSFPAMKSKATRRQKDNYISRRHLINKNSETVRSFDKDYPNLYDPSGYNNNCGPTSMIYVMVQALQNNPELVDIDKLNQALDDISQGGEYLIPRGTDLTELNNGVDQLRDLFNNPDLNNLHKTLKDKDNAYLPIMSAMRSLIRHSFLEACDNDESGVLNVLKEETLGDEFSNTDKTISKEWIQKSLSSFGIDIPVFALSEQTKIKGNQNVSTGKQNLVEIKNEDLTQMTGAAIFLKNGHFHVLSSADIR